VNEQLSLFDPHGDDPRREKVVAAMMVKERWLVVEAAYYLRCTRDHIYNLIEEGELDAFDIARKQGDGHRPEWRVIRDTVLAFETRRRAGAAQ
jgi:hypothetical protein